MVRLLELADVPRGRAGERSLLMAEQLGLDQLRGHRRAVQRNERSVAARAALVQGARDQLLARAGFAQNADARFARGHALHLRHHAPHGLARKHDLVLAHPLPKLPVLLFQMFQPQHIADGEQKFVGGKRLLQEIHRAQARGPHRHLDVRLSRNHHHRDMRAQRADVFEQRDAVFARHHDVGEHHIELLRLDQFQRARRRCRIR